jgi:dienelactone hydrolase
MIVMAEVLLFHHAQGQTPGFMAFADELRTAGHTVHTPDLYAGRTFDTLDDGVAHARQLGFESLQERGVQTAEGLPSKLVYAGFSLGVMPAQKLAQTRPGAVGALFFHSAIDPAEFGGPWPAGVPMQIHTMEDDDWGDVDVAREVANTVPEAELFLYPGSGHLFADSSLADYDAEAAALLMERALAFLAGIE